MNRPDPHTVYQTPEGEDPRPVYEGEWAKASGQQRARHATRVNAWRQRQKDKGLQPSSGSAFGSGKREEGQDKLEGVRQKANTATLEAIRDDAKALRSDRIQAIRLLAQLEGGKASSDVDEVSVWLQRERVLSMLDPHERLGWLLGQLREEEEQGHTPPLEGRGDARVAAASSVPAGAHPREEERSPVV